jgi:hypothetical protein
MDEKTALLQRLLNEALAHSEPISGRNSSLAVVGLPQTRLSVEVSTEVYEAMIAVAARDKLTIQELCEKMLEEYLAEKGIRQVCVARVQLGS